DGVDHARTAGDSVEIQHALMADAADEYDLDLLTRLDLPLFRVDIGAELHLAHVALGHELHLPVAGEEREERLWGIEDVGRLLGTDAMARRALDEQLSSERLAAHGREGDGDPILLDAEIVGHDGTCAKAWVRARLALSTACPHVVESRRVR